MVTSWPQLLPAPASLRIETSPLSSQSAGFPNKFTLLAPAPCLRLNWHALPWVAQACAWYQGYPSWIQSVKTTVVCKVNSSATVSEPECDPPSSGHLSGKRPWSSPVAVPCLFTHGRMGVALYGFHVETSHQHLFSELGHLRIQATSA